MSYPPRPSSTPTATADALAEHPTPSSQQGQSPLDWASYMNFQTPPVSGAGPAAPGMRGPVMGAYGNGNGSGSGHGQGQGQGQQQQGQTQGQGQTQDGQGRDDQYNFARGIAANTGGQANMQFHHPYGPTGLKGQQQQQQQQQGVSQSYGESHHQGQTSHTHPSARTHSRPSTSSTATTSNKGKSPASRQQNDLADQSTLAGDNGLTLDPAAFSRDIRFQVPSFLSNQMGGAPTFPPGGEAWSGFAGSNFFGDGSGAASLTPGTMFNTMFNLNGPGDQGHGQGQGQGQAQAQGQEGRDDGMGGFMGGFGHAWDLDWNSNVKHEVQGGVGQNQLGTTYYVNPNAQQAGRMGMLGNGQQGQGSQAPTQTFGSMDMSNGPSPSSSGPRSSIAPINASNPSPSPSQMAAPVLGGYPESNDPRRKSSNTSRGPLSNQPLHSHASSTPAQGANAVPGSGQGSMPTSALLPSFTVDAGGYAYPSNGVGSYSDNSNPVASTINIASSSTAPYAPPSNTQQLLTAPVAPGISGQSLAEGPGLYSTTGFDMVGVLARVAARKDPKTVLGPVDLSCSFAVVDVRRYDCPIVYASPTFTALTGYELPHMLGRNCRFLQSPDGEVVKGSKRKYTDNVAVAHLKRMLNAGKECQASLINYRRGGIPFINLVTVVPIPWDGTDIVYHVGFQIDLVEQPNAILRNMRDGSYQVNYTVANPPQPPLRPAGREPMLTGLSEDIVEIMGNRVAVPGFGQGEEGPKMDWLKMVLENSDDFIHVLSLKGMFQYVSPSVKRVLEYDPEDLTSKNISDICHPSDIVPLMRELKDSTHAPSEGGSARQVNLVFRIRRKVSGYVWIECTGRLHVEPGKGRKAVILSGRARSVPTLPWELVGAHGGLGEREFWAKLSFHGLLLHATPSVVDVLGQSPEEVQGLSLFSFIPGGENGPPLEEDTFNHDPTLPVSTFASALRRITSGNVRDAVTVSHRLVNSTGKHVDAITILYAPRARPELPARSDSDGNSSSPSSEDSSSLSNADVTIAGIKPSSIVAQVKLVSTSTPATSGSLAAITSGSSGTGARAIAQLTRAKPIAHPASSNLFEELETTRGTSWQYELHQLRLLNRRLKEDVGAARAVVVGNQQAGKGKGKRRKLGSGSAGAGEGEMGPPVMGQSAQGLGQGQGQGQGQGLQIQAQGQVQVQGQGQGQGQGQYNAAPRHQLAPGFGLVTQGMPGAFF